MAQQQPNQAQLQAMAVSLGLPPDAPLGVIDNFFKLMETSKGSHKERSVTSEMKKNIEQQIITYMKSRSLTYLQIKEKYLVYHDETKKASYSDELIQVAFVGFHRQNPQGSLEQMAINFVDYCNEVRKRSGERSEYLKIHTKRPVSATIAMLQNMGNL